MILCVSHSTVHRRVGRHGYRWWNTLPVYDRGLYDPTEITSRFFAQRLITDDDDVTRSVPTNMLH